MKLIFLIPLLVQLPVFAQKKVDKCPANLDTIVYDITPESLAPAHINLPFSRFEILDARYDTSKIGFMFFRRTTALDYKDFRRIKLKQQVARAIEDFYNEYYKLAVAASSDRLLIVLKKLWIDNLPSRTEKAKRYDIVRNSIQDIHVKLEYYLKRGDDFFPLKRLDTVYQLTEENIANENLALKRSDASFFSFVLKSVIEKNNYAEMITRVNVNRKYTSFQIDSFNRKRFLLPVLTNDSITNGVFMNFNEFVNNKPSITGYKFDRMGILKNSQDSVLNPFYWAYHDEQGFHITYSKKISLWRSGHTFEFFIVDAVALPKSLAGNLIDLMPLPGDRYITAGPGYKIRYVSSPRQIDMETGDIY